MCQWESASSTARFVEQLARDVPWQILPRWFLSNQHGLHRTGNIRPLLPKMINCIFSPLKFPAFIFSQLFIHSSKNPSFSIYFILEQNFFAQNLSQYKKFLIFELLYWWRMVMRDCVHSIAKKLSVNEWEESEWIHWLKKWHLVQRFTGCPNFLFWSRITFNKFLLSIL